MKKRISVQRLLFTLSFLVSAGILTPLTGSAEDVYLSMGQTVYVPIYSHIYSGVKGHPFDLAATLSIRNTDPQNPITLVEVKYYDTEGKLIRDYLAAPAQLKALASTRFIITEGDKAGGSGANYLVVWKSRTKVNPPLIESIMIGTQSGQGISFVSRGQVIKEE